MSIFSFYATLPSILDLIPLKNAEKTLNPSQIFSLNHAHKLPEFPPLNVWRQFATQASGIWFNVTTQAWPHGMFFFSKWSACEGLYLQPDHWVGSQTPKKGNQLKWDIFWKDLVFTIILEWKKQVIQMVSPTINATRDSSNSPRRHCDTVWPCSAACLYLKLLSYGKDQFNINRQARKTNDT